MTRKLVRCNRCEVVTTEDSAIAFHFEPWRPEIPNDLDLCENCFQLFVTWISSKLGKLSDKSST